MKLIDLQIQGFGKLNNKYIDFSDGVNVVTGHNEAGKSTLHSCIRAMLYGMERARGVAALTDTWSHYKPWLGKSYGAVMRIEYQGHIYRIERDFLKDPVGVVVYDETEMIKVVDPYGFMDQILCGMSSKAYDNTISIGQLKSSTGEDMSKELKAYIVNTDTTGNSALNSEEAKKHLTLKKEGLASKLNIEAAKQYASNLSNIKKLEKELSELGISKSDIDTEAEKYTDSDSDRLAESIDRDREILRRNYVYSAKQAIEGEMEFLTGCDAYEIEKNKNGIKKNRIVYILAFVLCLVALMAAAYMAGYGLEMQTVIYIAAGAALFFVIGIIFLILCLAARNRMHKKQIALGDLVGKYSGSSDITLEKTERIKEKLNDLKNLAVSVESREKKLSEIVKEEQGIKVEKPRDAKPTAKEMITELNELTLRNRILSTDIEKNDRIREDMEAIDLAIETIDDLAERMKDSLGVYMNAKASEYIKQITGGAYDSLSVDDELNVYMNTEDRMVPLHQLSGGTTDQIYMALRIAGARVMQKGKDMLPLVFDDSFVNYDEDRLRSALSWLVKDYDSQVVIFSCHKREAQILQDNNLTFNLISL